MIFILVFILIWGVFACWLLGKLSHGFSPCKHVCDPGDSVCLKCNHDLG